MTDNILHNVYLWTFNLNYPNIDIINPPDANGETMQTATQPRPQPLDDHARHAAPRAVLTLLGHWQCTEKEKMALLGVGR